MRSPFRSLIKSILSPSIRGRIGESQLAGSLDFLDLFAYNGYRLRNVYVPKANGDTSEIDLIYITRKGLFVIESKNYSGYIFGNEQYKYWTSTLYAGKSWIGFKKVEKHKFYNPIWQNNSHIKALRSYCGSVKTFSIIAFGNNCEFKSVDWNSPNVSICYYSELRSVIKTIWRNEPDVYDDSTVKRIYNSLASLNNDYVTKTKHVNAIRNANTGNSCPRCGGELVLRTAKSGAYAGNQFYGCSNYPKCKYIRNV